MKNLLLIGFIITLCTLGCRKTEQSVSTHSAIQVIWTGSHTSQTQIMATPDGGFVTSNTIIDNEFTSFKISQFDKDFNLVWEKIIGSPSSWEYEPKLFMDNQNNIIVTSNTLGFGQDSLPKTVSKSDGLYLHVIAPNGTTLWEKPFYFNTPFTTFLSNVTDLIQDADGNFIVSANLGYDPNFPYGVLLVIDKNGTLLKTHSVEGYKLQAIYDIDQFYFCYWDSEDELGVLKFKKSQLGGSNTFMDVEKIARPAFTKEKSTNETIEKGIHLKDTKAQTLQYLTRNDGSYLLNPNGVLTGKIVPQEINNFNALNISFDNHLLLSSGDVFYECTADFNVINTFKNKHLIFDKNHISNQQLCKLYSGDYVMSYLQEQKVYLYKYSSTGELIGNE